MSYKYNNTVRNEEGNESESDWFECSVSTKACSHLHEVDLKVDSLCVYERLSKNLARHFVVSKDLRSN